MVRYLFVTFWLLMSTCILAQHNDDDALFIKTIHDHSLTSGKAYDWLYHLSETIGGRLAGTAAAAEAVSYTQSVMEGMDADQVYLQPCTVKEWHRNGSATVDIVNDNGKISLTALALGNSVGTSPTGVTADVVEVKSLDEVHELGRAGIEGKIVFYNRPMDPTQLRTFNAYGGAVDQRVWGASTAAQYGGVAAVVRSMTLSIDDIPHTGTLAYKQDYDKVPGIAISTMDADMLSRYCKHLLT